MKLTIGQINDVAPLTYWGTSYVTTDLPSIYMKSVVLLPCACTSSHHHILGYTGPFIACGTVPPQEYIKRNLGECLLPDPGYQKRKDR